MLPLRLLYCPYLKSSGTRPKGVQQVIEKFPVDYDESGSIGRRYRRQDEIGTPYCITVDFDTLEDHSVTIRDRDTMVQIRLPIDEVEKYLEEKTSF